MRAIGWGRPLFIAGAHDFHGVVRVVVHRLTTTFLTACRGSWSVGTIDPYVLFVGIAVDQHDSFGAPEQELQWPPRWDRPCMACLGALGTEKRQPRRIAHAHRPQIRGAA